MVVDLLAEYAAYQVSAGGTTAPSAGTTESWTVTPTSGAPPASNSASPPTQFRVVDAADTHVPPEIMVVTNVSAGTWSVTRGAEGPAAPWAHAANWIAVPVLTPAGLLSWAQAHFPFLNSLGSMELAASGHTPGVGNATGFIGSVFCVGVTMSNNSPAVSGGGAYSYIYPDTGRGLWIEAPAPGNLATPGYINICPGGDNRNAGGDAGMICVQQGGGILNNAPCGVSFYDKNGNLGITICTYPGNPQGNMSGNRGDICFDYTNCLTYKCLTAGTASTAVWSTGSIGAVAATLTNGWANLAGYPHAYYYMDTGGRVWFGGTINGGTGGAAAFTLPVGMRPATNSVFMPVVAGGGVGFIQVNTSGQVIPPTSTDIWLDGVSFLPGV